MFMNKKGNILKNPMSIVGIILGIFIVTALVSALVPSAMTSIFGMVTSTSNNLTAAQRTTLTSVGLSLNYVLYLVAAVGLIIALVYVFVPSFTGKHKK